MASGKVYNPLAYETAAPFTHVKVSKSGRMVTVHIWTQANLSVSSNKWYTYGTLAAKYRPVIDAYFPAAEDLQGNECIECRVTSAGVVQAYLYAEKTYRPYATVTYLTSS